MAPAARALLRAQCSLTTDPERTIRITQIGLEKTARAGRASEGPSVPAAGDRKIPSDFANQCATPGSAMQILITKIAA